MLFAARVRRSAPNLTTLSAPAESAAPAVPAQRRHLSLQELATRDLLAAVKADPSTDFYDYLVTCRDAAHAVRNFMVHRAWARPERMAELLAAHVVPADLSDTRAGNLVGVLYLGILGAAEAKAQGHFRHHLTPQDRVRLQALANHLQDALRELQGLQNRLPALDRLRAFKFDEDSDPQELRHALKTLFHCLCVTEERVDGFWHPSATLATAAYRRFEPNAILARGGTQHALALVAPRRRAEAATPETPPKAPAPLSPRRQAAEAMAAKLQQAFFKRRLSVQELDRAGFIQEIASLLQAHGGAEDWAVARELCRCLGQCAVDAEELGLLAALVQGASLEYAAHYLSRRHVENTSHRLVALADTLGPEIQAWTLDPQLSDDLNALSGLLRAGFAKRTPPAELATNLGCYADLLRAHLRPCFVEEGGSPADIARQHFAENIAQVLAGTVENEIEDIRPLHPSNAHLSDAF